MSNSIRRRLGALAVMAVAAFAAAVPAQASATTAAERWEEGLQRMEDRFRDIEARRGYEAATEWWCQHWPAFHQRCGEFI